MKPTAKYFFLFIVFISTVVFSQNQITGIVSDGNIVLPNTSIRVKGTTTGVVSDTAGKYTIVAAPKDVLIFSHVGMKSLEITIEDVTRLLNIQLTPDIEELDEVVVSKYKRRTKKDLARTFYSDTTVISSGMMGYLSPRIVGYDLPVIDGKILNKNAYHILDAIAERLPGVVVRYVEGERLLFYSGGGSLRAAPSSNFGVERHLRKETANVPSIGNNKVPGSIAFDIDGQIWTTTPFHVQIKDVLRVGLIQGDQAVRHYGEVGMNGIVVINTTHITHGEREINGGPYDQAKIRSNVYANDAISQEAMRKNEPIYLRELYKSSNVEEANLISKKHKKNFGGSYVFALDNYQFFYDTYGDIAITNQILSDSELLFEENPMALKALAYVHQSNGDLQKANALYKEVFLLRSEYGQSYLDLANSYREINSYNKSAALYSRFNHLIGSELVKKDSSQFFEVFDRDFNNLVALKGKEIISDKAFETQLLEENFQGTRLVFEWNDGEAEFELQFVNPQGHYFKEEHSLFANAAEIQQEKQLGYSCKEFLMDDSLPGVWQINAKYLGNRKLTASYLKATIYYNYGLENQRKETKVFKLGLKNVNQELFKINIEPSVSTK